MNKLWVRLSLGFSGVVIVTAFLITLTGTIVGWLSHRYPPRDNLDRLEAMANLADELALYYQTWQSWAGSETLLLRAQNNFDDSAQERYNAFFLADATGQVVYHVRASQMGRPLNGIRQENLLPIRVNGQTVGYLGLDPIFRRDFEGPPDFVVGLARALFMTALIASGSGIVFGVLMSRSLTAPLNNLAQAAKSFGSRNLSRRVQEKGSAEMIAVARAFNEMATDLEQAEQLRRNLLADVAHELRTPLTVLQGNMRGILDEVFPCDNNEIARLYEHTRFLSRLVNDLHELAQAEAKQLPLDIQEIDLAQLVTAASDAFRPGAEAKEVALETDLPHNLPSLQVDAARLRQVLQNLLANALRHTPAGGAITIGAQAEAGVVRLTVSDTGDGIPPEHLLHIFDRFYRTDPARSRDKGGAGLGLAITRAIVEAHGGTISVASPGVPGEGTIFTIVLPGPPEQTQ
ncbi:MAG: HAMP domain-containing protein [Anaerolineae bacterium]|nr:HAMP domain-containing protein [Anaerolineae bacterium]